MFFSCIGGTRKVITSGGTHCGTAILAQCGGNGIYISIHRLHSITRISQSPTDQIVGTLKKAGIEVVAITDHHVMDVDLIKALQSLAKEDLTVLPGIEFLSDLGGKEKVHLIGIFSEDCDI